MPPIQFQITPSSKLAKPITPKGRLKGQNISSQIAKAKKTSIESRATKKRTTIQLSAYGNRLFEPALTRERPVVVEFVDFFSSDSCRFSKDGFFAIKYIVLERRCYLFYFINPIRVHKQITLALACQEAIEYKSWEFYDDDEYKEALECKDPEKLVKIEDKSVLGKVKSQICNILKEIKVAERFLKRQRVIEKEEKEWKDYFDDLHKIEDEEELKKGKENSDVEQFELESQRDTSNDISGQQQQEITSQQEIEETEPIQVEERKEDEGKRIEIKEKRVEGERKTFKISWGVKK